MLSLKSCLPFCILAASAKELSSKIENRVQESQGRHMNGPSAAWCIYSKEKKKYIQIIISHIFSRNYILIFLKKWYLMIRTQLAKLRFCDIFCWISVSLSHWKIIRTFFLSSLILGEVSGGQDQHRRWEMKALFSLNHLDTSYLQVNRGSAIDLKCVHHIYQ